MSDLHSPSQSSGPKLGGASTKKYGSKPCTNAATDAPCASTPNMRSTGASERSQPGRRRWSGGKVVKSTSICWKAVVGERVVCFTGERERKRVGRECEGVGRECESVGKE